jgi:hypothetical protein
VSVRERISSAVLLTINENEEMCCIFEIALFIIGIYSLIKGKFALSKEKVLTGTYARIVGVICIAILPSIVIVAFTAGIAWGIIHGSEEPFPMMIAVFIDLGGLAIGISVILLVTNILVNKQKKQLEESMRKDPD